MSQHTVEPHLASNVVYAPAGGVIVHSRANSISKVDIEHVEEGFTDGEVQREANDVDQSGIQLGYSPEEKKPVRKLDT
ncbi:hypothetical protein IAU59_007196 [Kwoniella sp. CBS 9459]